LYLVRDLSGHDESQPLAGLGCDVNRVGESGLLPFQVSDLLAERGLAGGQLFHFGALREIRTYRPRDGQGQDTHHRRKDGSSARGEPEPLLALLLNRRRDDASDRSGQVVTYRLRLRAQAGRTRTPGAADCRA
jgi:hypothetical protein